MQTRTFEITLRATVDENTEWPDGTGGFLDSLNSDSGNPGDSVAEMISVRNSGMPLSLVGAVEVAGR